MKLMTDRLEISIKVKRLKQQSLRIMVSKSCSSTLPITRNLYRALKQLRCNNQSRVFWIDAICVNQQDMDERGHQVQRMADIYR